MYKLVKPGRVWALAALFVLIIIVYTVFLYQRQIVEGEQLANQSSEIGNTKRTVTAARGNILDRYGRVLVSNKECYNLTIDTAKLFANEDPNTIILELVDMVNGYGDIYIDDLPISLSPPFEYDPDMTEIQRTMLEAYFVDHAKDFKEAGLPASPTAVELMSYMRGRYGISNSFSSEEMRIICGVRYSINVRYAINTANYVFVQDASMNLISSIMEQKLVGIEITRAYVRDYNTEYASHILGYVGLMTQEEYELYSLQEYSTDASVGKDGAEYAFEDYLHGKDGEVEEYKNSAGTILATKYLTEPEPGNHVYLTIDIVLQEQVERILNNGVNTLILNREIAKVEAAQRGEPANPELKDEITGAAAVVVDVRTGEPLAIASWPTYDVSTIIEKYQELLDTPNDPLFNRALMGAYAPGSSFKPCTAIASLSEGIINTEDTIKCQGVFTKYAAEGYAPECWIWAEGFTHPEENVSDALRDSCNYFFYTVGNDLGVDLLQEYANGLGLGVSTGIELTETLGNMSNRETHVEMQGEVWRIGDTLQAAIGQSDSIFSPLQLCEYCAAVANGGVRHSASILKSVRSFDYAKNIYEREAEVLSTVESEDYNWAAVQNGMWQVLNSSWNQTNYEIWLDCAWKCAGKTGTAQKGENITNDGIFMCYGPYDNPQVAIEIIVERGGSGASVQFIARQIMDAYINIQSYSDSSEEEMALLR